jgi:hypothetical protein
MDDMVIIWPHGPGKLIDFVGYLNSVHENIVYYGDGKSGHSVYYKTKQPQNLLQDEMLTSITVLTPTTTTTMLPTNSMYFPCWCTGTQSSMTA